MILLEHEKTIWRAGRRKKRSESLGEEREIEKEKKKKKKKEKKMNKKEIPTVV